MKYVTFLKSLGRDFTFNYDTNANLISITQNWTVNGVPQTHVWATFGWGTLTMQPEVGSTHSKDTIGKAARGSQPTLTARPRKPATQAAVARVAKW